MKESGGGGFCLFNSFGGSRGVFIGEFKLRI